jgi:hypothetical protein
MFAEAEIDAVAPAFRFTDFAKGIGGLLTVVIPAES